MFLILHEIYVLILSCCYHRNPSNVLNHSECTNQNDIICTFWRLILPFDHSQNVSNKYYFVSNEYFSPIRFPLERLDRDTEYFSDFWKILPPPAIFRKMGAPALKQTDLATFGTLDFGGYFHPKYFTHYILLIF